MFRHFFRKLSARTRLTRPTARPAVECLEDRTVPAHLPTGFTESVVASGMSSPTAMEFAPNGDLWVLEQGGTVKRFVPGSTSADIVGKLDGLGLDDNGERGLLGIAFDPDYDNSKHVYLYYTSTDGGTHNRISIFTVDDTDTSDYFFIGTDSDVSDAGSSGNPTEDVLLNLNALSSATNHNGGAMHFSPYDGMLYVAVGENANPSNSQKLTNLLGKILRLNPDGSIPSDNPFVDSTSGKNQAIWALGLRNPFTFAFNPDSSASVKMFINDVGQNATEEINKGVAGSNYGWPDVEGTVGTPPTGPGDYRAPTSRYAHGSGTFEGFAITGGAFYSPSTQQFPSIYAGDYFFADYVNSWIHVMDLGTLKVTEFATNAKNPVDLRVSDDGSLFYLSIGDGTVHRVRFINSTVPNITKQPANATVSLHHKATFSVTATGSSLGYQWQKFNGSNWVDLSDGGRVSGATSAKLSITDAHTGNSGKYHVVVTNSFGKDTSRTTSLTVTPDQPPVPSIHIDAGLTAGKFIAGQQINFSGSATDPEEGTLGADAFTWKVDYITTIQSGNPAVRPFVPSFSGVTSSNFTPATTGPYTKTDVAYRITLKVTDSDGQSKTVTRQISPQVVTLTVGTQPVPMKFTVDGQTFSALRTFTSVVGFQHELGAASQLYKNELFDFKSWSDGGDPTHTISTPQNNSTYTATFAQAFLAKVNFQAPSSQGVVGFMPDIGEVFGLRASGLSYGWNADMTDKAFNHNSGNSPDERYDTYVRMASPTNHDAFWEMAVPNGTYRVHIVAGDAVLSGSTYKINVEDQLAIDGVQTPEQRWLDNYVVVTVTDGRLTISNAPGAYLNRLCYVRIAMLSHA